MLEYENRTRQGLDAALRELLRQKPLDQLRVRELTERCGLRRQSFYYHFKDVYDLFLWSIQQERALLLARREECLTWQQAFSELLDRIAENRAFYQAVLDYGGQRKLGELIPVNEVLAAVQAYYRDRCGVPPDGFGEERDRRCGEAMLLSLLESWIRGELALTEEDMVFSLERAVERGTTGAVWQTLREQGNFR